MFTKNKTFWKFQTDITILIMFYILFFDYQTLFQVEVNMAILSKSGSWKNNGFMYKSGNACNKIKFIFGKSFYSIQKALNTQINSCPIPAVTILELYSNLKYNNL